MTRRDLPLIVLVAICLAMALSPIFAAAAKLDDQRMTRECSTRAC